MDQSIDKLYCQELIVRGANSFETDVNFAASLLLQPVTFTITTAAGASNICTVTITVKDAAGNVLTGVRNIEFWVSDVATGIGRAVTFDPDTLAATTGTVLTVLTAAEHLLCQTDVNGVLVLSVTDAAKAAGYVCVVDPVTGLITTALITATTDYGA